MALTCVTLIKCPDYDSSHIAKAIAQQFANSEVLGKSIKPGDKVLVKPNLIAPKSKRFATQTHPAVIYETAKFLKDFGAKPFVADSPAWSDTKNCIKKLKLDGPLKKLGVEVKQLNQPVKVALPGVGIKVNISSVAIEADAIINLPKFKTHQQIVATFAVKNMFGCVSGKQKAFWHFAKGKDPHEFCKLLIEIYKYMNPALTIIDGVIAMDGPGPIRGRARPLGWIVGSTEPISCELICAKLIDLDPAKLPIVQTAKKIGFGQQDFENIKILGDAMPTACTDFEPAEMMPIQFSLFRVCKSIAKQLLLKVKRKFVAQH